MLSGHGYGCTRDFTPRDVPRSHGHGLFLTHWLHHHVPLQTAAAHDAELSELQGQLASVQARSQQTEDLYESMLKEMKSALDGGCSCGVRHAAAGVVACGHCGGALCTTSVDMCATWGHRCREIRGAGYVLQYKDTRAEFCLHFPCSFTDALSREKTLHGELSAMQSRAEELQQQAERAARGLGESSAQEEALRKEVARLKHVVDQYKVQQAVRRVRQLRLRLRC